MALFNHQMRAIIIFGNTKYQHRWESEYSQKELEAVYLCVSRLRKKRDWREARIPVVSQGRKMVQPSEKGTKRNEG